MNNIDKLRLDLLDLNIQVRDLKREVERINQADRIESLSISQRNQTAWNSNTQQQILNLDRTLTFLSNGENNENVQVYVFVVIQILFMIFTLTYIVYLLSLNQD